MCVGGGGGGGSALVPGLLTQLYDRGPLWLAPVSLHLLMSPLAVL